MDILYVGTLPPHVGGSATVGGDLTAGWAARGHAVRAIAPIVAMDAHPDLFAERFPRVEVERYPVLTYITSSQRPDPAHEAAERDAVTRIATRCIDERLPDVVVSARESFGWTVPDLARAAGVACVQMLQSSPWVEIAGDPVTRPRFQAWRAASSSATEFVSVALHMAHDFERLGVRPVTTISNGVDTNVFAPGPPDPELAASLGIEPGDVVVLHASNFKDLKRTTDVVASGAVAMAVNPHLRYVLLGDGETMADTRAAIDALPDEIASRFVTTGWVDRVRMPDYLHLARIALLPSEREACALAALEALASGCVLIASDIPASHEVVADGRDCLLHPVGDIASMAELTLRVAADDRLHARLAAAGRRVAMAHDLDTVVDRYVEVLEEAARRGERAGAVA